MEGEWMVEQKRIFVKRIVLTTNDERAKKFINYKKKWKKNINHIRTHEDRVIKIKKIHDLQ